MPSAQRQAFLLKRIQDYDSERYDYSRAVFARQFINDFKEWNIQDFYGGVGSNIRQELRAVLKEDWNFKFPTTPRNLGIQFCSFRGKLRESLEGVDLRAQRE